MPVAQKLIDQAVDAVVEHGTVTKAAAALGIPVTTLRDRYRRRQPSVIDPEVKSEGATEKWEVSENDSQKNISSFSWEVRTVEDALRKAEIDTAIWEVEKTKLNSYPIAMKLKQTDKSHKVETRWLWQVKIQLRRKISRVCEDASKLLLERMKRFTPSSQKILRPKQISDPCMLEIALWDVHYAKLARSLTDESANTLEADEQVFLRAGEQLLSRVSGFNLEKILFPIGNDFLNIDDHRSTTTNGTPQSSARGYADILHAGQMSLIKLIQRCTEIAPVEVVPVGGNHDRMTTIHTSRFLWAWYRGNKHVKVDLSVDSRKYITYGATLLGMYHGDVIKGDRLPNIMITERPQEFAATRHHEWHLGHIHTKRETKYNAGDTHNGITVRHIPSLSKTDEWHFDNGYVKNARTAEGYVWSKADGYAGHFSTPPLVN